MEQRTIPPHVWLLVLPYIRKAIPEPLSRPPRSALRQQDLTSASRLFREICYSLLYTHIVTDSLPELLSTLQKPSRRRTLTLTQTLRVEYIEKNDEDPSYVKLCKTGRWAWADCGAYGGELVEQELRKRARCGREVNELTACLTVLNGIGTNEVFPKLKTIAFASIYGSNPDTQHYYDAVVSKYRSREIGSDSSVCLEEFNRFISAGDLQHLCIRDTCGPLSLHNLLFAAGYRLKLTATVTAHLPLAVQHLPVRLSHPVRYTIDCRPTDDWSDTLRWLEACIRRTIKFRTMKASDARPEDIADMEIFSSTELYNRYVSNKDVDFFGLDPPTNLPRHFSPSDQAEMVKVLEKTVQEKFRRASGLPDRVRWRVSAETPICQACGSGPPAQRA